MSADDWYQRRREDAVGRFFRSLAESAGREGEGGSTRQGIYLFTADGSLLGAHNNRSANRHLAVAEAALQAWDALPEERRRPGAVQIAPLDETTLDRRYHRPLPPDVYVIDVHARALKRDPASGALQSCSSSVEGVTRGDGPSVDHLWIRHNEWSELVAAAGRDGKAAFPPALISRILRFHLVDNTRGEPPMWGPSEIRSSRLELIRTGPNEFRLEGEALLSTDPDPIAAQRGFDAKLSGEIAGDEKGLTRFDLLALGEHWGEGPFTRGARPGRQPFAVAFTLGQPGAVGHEVPPQGIRFEDGYYQADRH